MPLSTTNILPTTVLKDSCDHAYNAGLWLKAGAHYVQHNTAGSGETFPIPYFGKIAPSFVPDETALTDNNYTPSKRDILIRKVQKGGVYINDSDAAINGEYIAREAGVQIGEDNAEYFCNVIVHGVAEVARAAGNLTEVTGAAGAPALSNEANIQAAYWNLINDARAQGMTLSRCVAIVHPTVAVAWRKIQNLSNMDYTRKESEATRPGYFDMFFAPGGLAVISPINLWFGTNKSADTNLPNDAKPVSARLDYTNYYGVLYDTRKLHVGITEPISIKDERVAGGKFQTLYTGYSIWGFNLSDTAGARALMNASA